MSKMAVKMRLCMLSHVSTRYSITLRPHLQHFRTHIVLSELRPIHNNSSCPDMASCHPRLRPPLGHQLFTSAASASPPPILMIKPIGGRRLSFCHCANLDSAESEKLVWEVKEKLKEQYNTLPVGQYGRDDEEMILWFLKDRKFCVADAISKLVKAIRWRHEFGVSELSEESVDGALGTGKAYLHDSLDVTGRPVLIVDVSKHFPEMQDPKEDEKLCVFLIEKALSRLPAGKQNILVIMDLRRFGMANADLRFLTFLFDVFYCYYPRRLGQVIFVEAPFIFKPIWQLVKPMLKSYASLVRFSSVKTLREEYFTEETVPAAFRE